LKPGKTEVAIKKRKAELNILFTCAGRRVALIDAFRQAMEELGVDGKIIITDITAASPAFHLADEGEIICEAGRIEYIPSLLKLVEKHEVGLIVPLTDLDLRSLARQKDKFAEKNCEVMIGSESSVALCRDKARFNRLLAEAGIQAIRTYTLNEFHSSPFYPCFIKPIRGSASVGTGVIRNGKELQAHIATFGELLIVQEYVPGQEYTIDVYKNQKGEVKSIVPRQRLVVRSGEVEKGITVNDPVLIESSLKVANMLEDIWGVFCCQCRMTEGRPPKFFEINPRFGGGVPLSIAAGANFPLYVLQEVLELPVSADIGKFAENLLMLRYDKAVFIKENDRESLPGFHEPQFR